MYLSENFLIASLSPLTSSLSSNNSLIFKLEAGFTLLCFSWIKSSGSWPLVGLHSKKDNGSLVACHSQDMVVELEVERW